MVGGVAVVLFKSFNIGGFIRAFEAAANLGLKASAELGRPIRIHAPLVALTKAQIILKGVGLGK